MSLTAPVWLFAINFWLLIVSMFVRYYARDFMGPMGGQASLMASSMLFATVLYLTATLVPLLTVTVRRLHDSDHSGWWLLIQALPGVGTLVLFVLLVTSGTDAENRFGPDPRPTRVTPGAAIAS